MLEKEKARLNEELKDLQSRDQDQKLNMNTLYDKIQSLTQDNLLSSQLDTSGTLNTSLQTSDNSLTTIIDILRKIKDKEMEMRMAAEIELSRIKAQAHIDEQRIHELSEQVEEANKQIQINAQLVNEKNELIDRLGSLQAVQRKAAELQQELQNTLARVTNLTQNVSFSLIQLNAFFKHYINHCRTLVYKLKTIICFKLKHHWNKNVLQLCKNLLKLKKIWEQLVNGVLMSKNKLLKVVHPKLIMLNLSNYSLKRRQLLRRLLKLKNLQDHIVIDLKLWKLKNQSLRLVNIFMDV